MRRGWALVELVVSMGLLAIVMGAALPMLFIGDRALDRQQTRAGQVAAGTNLLRDLSHDLRGAQVVSNSAEGLAVDSHRYRSSATGTTQIVNREGETREYPGARFSVAPQGRLVRIAVTSGSLHLQTTVWRRN